MRIVIDLQACQSDSRLGGIGRYSMNLAEAMLRHTKKHELHFVLSGLMQEGMKKLKQRVPKEHIHTFEFPGPVAETSPENSFRARSAELLRENFIFNLKPDIVHVSSLIEGFSDNVTTSVGRLLPGTSTSVTLYDLIPWVDRSYLSEENLKKHYLRKIEDFCNASLFLSISEYSRQEAISLLSLPTDSIINISSAVDEIFKKIEISVEQANAIKQKYGIRKDFLLFVGSFDKRKNQEALISAFANLPFKVREELQLIFIGNGWHGVYEHYRNFAKKRAVESDVIFLGKVFDDDMVLLYNLCLLFVFPSLKEGFGLPVLEAMSCGAPVIASNTTSIPEIMNFKEALFDPTCIGGMTQKLYQAITNKNFRNFLSQYGLKRSQEFSWDLSAKKAISAFEEFYESKIRAQNICIQPLSSKQLIEKIALLPEASFATENDLVATAKSIEEMEKKQKKENTLSLSTNKDFKVGFVTTWSTRCGIAAYSEHLVKNLCESVFIFAPDTSEMLTKPDQFNVRRCWNIDDAERLYNLSAEIEACGVETLVIQFNYGFFNFNYFSDFLNAQVDAKRRVIVTLHSTTDPVKELEKNLALLIPAFARCYKILVHSQKDIDRLEALGLNPHQIELFYLGVIDYQPPTVSKPADKEFFLLASYGYFLPHKGFYELIDAVALLRHEKKMNVVLWMINAKYPTPLSAALIDGAKEKIKNLGLRGYVHLIDDFLKDEESLSFLSQADLIVFPYQDSNESSSAAIRHSLAAQRPTVATQIKIFDDVSDFVFFLPGKTPKAIAKGIKNVIQEMVDNTENFKFKVEKARCWVKSHDYLHLALKLKKLIQS